MPVLFRDDKVTKIQGPNSNLLKYQHNLCKPCNSTTTQPFDVAYEKFQNWLYANEDQVLSRRFVDFFEVYGESFETDQLNLYKYYVKSFGCRLHNEQIDVPKDLIVLLSKTRFQTGLRITFCVNEAVLDLPKVDRDSFVGKGQLFLAGGSSFIWSESVSWFTAGLWYLSDPDPTLGSVWTANARVVYLGAHNPLDEDELSQLHTTLSKKERDASKRKIET